MRKIRSQVLRDTFPDSVAPGTLRLQDAHIPSLPAGKYTITATHDISFEDPSKNKVSKSDSGSQTFEVTAPRFTIDPSQLQALSPPPNSAGLYGTHLPHITFKDPYLPWERRLKGKIGVPWMAVLTLSPDELLPVGNPTEMTSTRAIKIKVGDLSKNIPDRTTVPSLDLQKDELDQGCQVITIRNSNFKAWIPSLLSLPYLAHTRTINTGDKVIDGLNEKGTFATVYASRFPKVSSKDPTLNIAHLISIEGIEEYINKVKSLDDLGTIRLISLCSWSFMTNPQQKEDFELLMKNVVSGAQLLRVPSNSKAEIKQEIDAIAPRLEQGYTPVRHRTATGEETVAWYRGPLFPANSGLPSDIPITSRNGSNLLIYDPSLGVFDTTYSSAWHLGRCLAIADSSFTTSLVEYRRYVHVEVRHLVKGSLTGNKHKFVQGIGYLIHRVHNKTRGATETPVSVNTESYTSSPYQENPLILSSSPPVLEEKSVWKRPLPLQSSSLTALNRLTHTRNIVRDSNPETDGHLNVILAWIFNLRLLYSVPFYYLVPNPEMLPVESIRFFEVDSTWIDSMVDGALSIVVHLDQDEEMRSELKKKIKEDHKDHIPVCGFLLRSAIVSGWPGLCVKVEDQRDNIQNTLVRMDRLSPNTLLCLFSIHPRWITISEPTEQLSFGLSGDSFDQGYMELRNLRSDAPIGRVLKLSDGLFARVELKDQGSDVWNSETKCFNAYNLANQGLLPALKAHRLVGEKSEMTPADFGLQMVRSAASGVFGQLPNILRGWYKPYLVSQTMSGVPTVNSAFTNSITSKTSMFLYTISWDDELECGTKHTFRIQIQNTKGKAEGQIKIRIPCYLKDSPKFSLLTSDLPSLIPLDGSSKWGCILRDDSGTGVFTLIIQPDPNSALGDSITLTLNEAKISAKAETATIEIIETPGKPEEIPVTKLPKNFGISDMYAIAKGGDGSGITLAPVGQELQIVWTMETTNPVIADVTLSWKNAPKGGVDVTDQGSGQVLYPNGIQPSIVIKEDTYFTLKARLRNGNRPTRSLPWNVQVMKPHLDDLPVFENCPNGIVDAGVSVTISWIVAQYGDINSADKVFVKGFISGGDGSSDIIFTRGKEFSWPEVTQCSFDATLSCTITVTPRINGKNGEAKRVDLTVANPQISMFECKTLIPGGQSTISYTGKSIGYYDLNVLWRDVNGESISVFVVKGLSDENTNWIAPSNILNASFTLTAYSIAYGQYPNSKPPITKTLIVNIDTYKSEVIPYSDREFPSWPKELIASRIQEFMLPSSDVITDVCVNVSGNKVYGIQEIKSLPLGQIMNPEATTTSTKNDLIPSVVGETITTQWFSRPKSGYALSGIILNQNPNYLYLSGISFIWTASQNSAADITNGISDSSTPVTYKFSDVTKKTFLHNFKIRYVSYLLFSNMMANINQASFVSSSAISTNAIMDSSSNYLGHPIKVIKGKSIHLEYIYISSWSHNVPTDHDCLLVGDSVDLSIEIGNGYSVHSFTSVESIVITIPCGNQPGKLIQKCPGRPPYVSNNVWRVTLEDDTKQGTCKLTITPKVGNFLVVGERPVILKIPQVQINQHPEQISITVSEMSIQEVSKSKDLHFEKMPAKFVLTNLTVADLADHVNPIRRGVPVLVRWKMLIPDQCKVELSWTNSVDSIDVTSCGSIGKLVSVAYPPSGSKSLVIDANPIMFTLSITFPKYPDYIYTIQKTIMIDEPMVSIGIDGSIAEVGKPLKILWNTYGIDRYIIKVRSNGMDTVIVDGEDSPDSRKVSIGDFLKDVTYIPDRSLTCLSITGYSESKEVCSAEHHITMCHPTFTMFPLIDTPNKIYAALATNDTEVDLIYVLSGTRSNSRGLSLDRYTVQYDKILEMETVCTEWPFSNDDIHSMLSKDTLKLFSDKEKLMVCRLPGENRQSCLSFSEQELKTVPQVKVFLTSVVPIVHQSISGYTFNFETMEVVVHGPLKKTRFKIPGAILCKPVVSRGFSKQMYIPFFDQEIQKSRIFRIDLQTLETSIHGKINCTIQCLSLHPFEDKIYGIDKAKILIFDLSTEGIQQIDTKEMDPNQICFSPCATRFYVTFYSRDEGMVLGTFDAKSGLIQSLETLCLTAQPIMIIPSPNGRVVYCVANNTIKMFYCTRVPIF